MGRGVQKSKQLSQLNGFKNSELQEEDDLHNAILLSLNIQNDTSARSRTNNRIAINSINTTRVTNPVWTPKVPTIMLANVMSLAPKMDEVSEFILRHNTSLASITETWLKDSVSDGVVQIPGFAVVRKDRKVIDHGGVCAYIQEGNCRYKQLKDLNCCEDHESLWLYLRPNRLPRGFSCIIAGVIYHPPKVDGPLFRDHLFRSLALTEARSPNCGLLVTGDFNRLNIDGLLNHFRLKQIVKVPTRKKATLDLILTNMHEYYSPPQAYPPFGLSDHNVVVATPACCTAGPWVRMETEPL